MKKNFLVSLVLLLQIGQTALGQTDKLVKVAGTKCSLVPPDGFVAATSFSGFQSNETGATIMVNELPAPYHSIVEGFTSEAFKSKGMTIVSKQTIDFNNSKALLLNVTQPANGTTYIKQMLIFGDTKGTVMINGIYPEAAKYIEAQIKDAILSTVYDIDRNDNPLDAAIFTIDITNTDFKLCKYMSGSLIYSTDGKIPTEKPTLIVGNSFSKVTSQNHKTYSIERLKKLPKGEENIVKEITEVTIDNLKGYEIIAEGKTVDNKPELLYQVLLFNDAGDYHIIIGQAKEDFEKNIEIFRSVAKTFKRK